MKENPGNLVSPLSLDASPCCIIRSDFPHCRMIPNLTIFPWHVFLALLEAHKCYTYED